MTPNNPPLQETAHKYGYPQAGVSCEENVTGQAERKEEAGVKQGGKGGLGHHWSWELIREVG